MRLSKWQKTAPTRDSMNSKVTAVLRPVLADLGADGDPECWVAWGEDPGLRYSVLAPTVVGLINAAVRPSGGDEGPRATAKLIRWSKLSVSELGIEASGGHRLVAVQVESLVLKGVDDEADRICEFVRGLIAAVDGRAPQLLPAVSIPAAAAATGAAKATQPSGARAAAGPTAKKLPAAGARKPSPAIQAARTPGKAAGGPSHKPPVKPAATPARGAASKPASAPKPAPVPEAAALAATPKGIPARVPAHPRGSRPDHPVAPAAPSVAKEAPAGREQVEPEPSRSDWISPHPIEAPAGEQKRPRPWTP